MRPTILKIKYFSAFGIQNSLDTCHTKNESFRNVKVEVLKGHTEPANKRCQFFFYLNSNDRSGELQVNSINMHIFIQLSKMAFSCTLHRASNRKSASMQKQLTSVFLVRPTLAR